MSCRVIIMPQAASDFEGCFGYIAQRSERGAMALRNAFVIAVKSLATNALAHGFAPESKEHSRQIRQILFRTKQGRNSRALYTIKVEEVNVIHVRGPGQDFISPDELRVT